MLPVITLMPPPLGLAARYLDSLRHANYSEATIYGRGRVIIRFRRATGIDPLEASEDQMIGWFAELGLTPASRAVALSVVRSYCRWAVRHRHIAEDPTRLLDRPRIPRRYPRPIDEVSLSRAIMSAPTDVRVILCLAAFGGLRACEISRLTWSDVKKDVLILHGKGSKERIIPGHPAISDALHALPGKRKGYILQRRDYEGGLVKPHLVSQWANKHLHSMGIPETLHQLRHRYATQVYQLSRDIRLTQDLMGHASPDTTALYSAWEKSQAAVVVALLPSP